MSAPAWAVDIRTAQDRARSYAGRHRTRKGSLTMNAARRSTMARRPAAIAVELRMLAAKATYLDEALDRDLWLRAADVLDGKVDET